MNAQRYEINYELRITYFSYSVIQLFRYSFFRVNQYVKELIEISASAALCAFSVALCVIVIVLHGVAQRRHGVTQRSLKRRFYRANIYRPFLNARITQYILIKGYKRIAARINRRRIRHGRMVGIQKICSATPQSFQIVG